MIVRTIRPEESPEFQRIQNVAYNFSMDDSGDAALLPSSPEAEAELERQYAAFSEDGAMAAVTHALLFEANFLGEQVRVGGIGGVASYPEYRRGGGVRLLMEACVRRFEADGCLLSALYPFRQLFYRKFGYEVIQQGWRYALRPERIIPRIAPLEGDWVMLRQPGDLARDDVQVRRDFDDWHRLNEAVGARFDGYFVARPDRRQRIERMNPFASQDYAYLMRDRSGEPVAGLAFRSAERRFNVYELLFTDGPSLVAILAFTQRFAADIDEVSIGLPTGFNLASLIEDCPSPQAETSMLRVIDAEGLLERLYARWQRRHPGAQLPEGFAIAVEDDLLERNCARFVFTPQGLRREARQGDDGARCVVVDIRELAALTTGDLRPGDLPLLRVDASTAALRDPAVAAAFGECFADRRWYMRTYF